MGGQEPTKHSREDKGKSIEIAVKKAEIVLALAEIEAERARVRQEATQLVGRGVQKKDVMVAPSEGATNSLSDDEKGESIVLATKKARDEGCYG